MVSILPGRALLAAASSGVAASLIGIPVLVAVLLAIAVFLAAGGGRFLRVVYRTFPRDLRFIRFFSNLVKELEHARANGITVCDDFAQTVKRHPDKLALIMDEKEWTFHKLDEFSNRVAHYFRTRDFVKGDTVAVLMENCPEMVGVMIGFWKLGVVTALINTNLRHDMLTYSINISKSRAVIFSASLSEALGEVLSDLDQDYSGMLYSVCGVESLKEAKMLESEIEQASPYPPPQPANKSTKDILCYIYTSGTTGMPKAAKVTNERFHGGGRIGGLAGVVSNDIIYCTLPLFHSSATLMALGLTVVSGTTLVLRKKFSASNFWKDSIKYHCTVTFYIGEICRYLLAQPKHPTDTQHRIRITIGNGLRPHIWREFKERFHIPNIAEFYSSSEGNVGMINNTDKVGACGYLPVLFLSSNAVRFLKVDSETGKHVKDSNGFCIEAAINEPGEAIGKISKDIGRVFDGYQDQAATNTKIRRNVFKPGDSYFLSGDILRMDGEGFVYFCDRMGDTYRWKGENVSTTEVESIIGKILDLRDVVAYGVEIPGKEGRAGMVAIAGSREAVDPLSLAERLLEKLPRYALPLFIRLIDSAELTGTFKLQKVCLKREGFNLDVISDPVYFLEPTSSTYVIFSHKTLKELVSGAIMV